MIFHNSLFMIEYEMVLFYIDVPELFLQGLQKLFWQMDNVIYLVQN